MEKSWYLLLDAMAIQSYIFATNKLKIILGSSRALALWQTGCRNLAKECGGEIITSAGGNILARFAAGKEALDFRIKTLEHNNLPPEMEIAWALTERSGSDADKDVWQRLQIEIARYKAGDRPAEDYPEKPWPEPPGCQFCGVRPADENENIEGRKICRRCRTLYKRAKTAQTDPENSGLDQLTSWVEKEWNKNFPDDLEKMVTFERETRNLLAAVVIDLNNMGNRIKKLVEKQGFSALENFSRTLEEDILDTIKESIKVLRADKNGLADNATIRLRPLVAAGDDLIFTLPARLWVDFTKKMLESLDKKGYPACAGVAIAKHSFPLNRLVLMAESLCDNAKKHLRFLKTETVDDKTGTPETALDWHLHQESSMLDPLAVRRRQSVSNPKKDEFTITTGRPYTLQEAVRRRQSVSNPKKDEFTITTGRPYTLQEFTTLLEETKTAWAKISNRKLFALYSALHQGPQATRELLKYTFLRREKEDMSLFEPLWKKVCTLDGRYPLWEEQKFNDGTLVYHSAITDQLELKWLMQGPLTEGSDD